jgi:hypothetical protein
MDLYRISTPYCFGNQPEAMRLLEAVKRFLQVHRSRPHFLFSFLWKLSHDLTNQVCRGTETRSTN